MRWIAVLVLVACEEPSLLVEELTCSDGPVDPPAGYVLAAAFACEERGCIEVSASTDPGGAWYHSCTEETSFSRLIWAHGGTDGD